MNATVNMAKVLRAVRYLNTRLSKTNEKPLGSWSVSKQRLDGGSYPRRFCFFFCSSHTRGLYRDYHDAQAVRQRYVIMLTVSPRWAEQSYPYLSCHLWLLTLTQLAGMNSLLMRPWNGISHHAQVATHLTILISHRAGH